MNKLQREVIQKHQQEMTRSIYVDSEFLGKCYQAGMFDSIAIDTINGETENENKVTKMLDVLQQRQEVDTFDKFVTILEQTNMLLVQAMKTSLQELNNPNTYKYVKTNPSQKSPRPETPSEDSSQKDAEEQILTEEITLSPFDTNIPVEMEIPAQQKLCFDCLRTICSNCKKKIHSNESFRVKVPEQKTSEGNNKGIELKEFTKSNIKQTLIDMCLKKKIDVGIFEDCAENPDADFSGSDILSLSELDSIEDDNSPTTKLNAFNFLERQINSLLNKIKQLEDQLSQCYDILDDATRTESLSIHFEKLLKKCHDLQEQVDVKTGFAEDLLNERKIDEKLKRVMLKEKETKITELQQVNIKLQKDFEKLNTRLDECEKTISSKKSHTFEEMEVFNEDNNPGKSGGIEIDKQLLKGGGIEIDKPLLKGLGIETDKPPPVLHEILIPNPNRPGYVNDTSGQHTRFQAKMGLEKADIARLQELQAARERNKALLNKKHPNSRNYVSQPQGHRSLHDLGLPKIDRYEDGSNSQSHLRIPKKNPYYQSKFSPYH